MFPYFFLPLVNTTLPAMDAKPCSQGRQADLEHSPEDSGFSEVGLDEWMTKRSTRKACHQLQVLACCPMQKRLQQPSRPPALPCNAKSQDTGSTDTGEQQEQALLPSYCCLQHVSEIFDNIKVCHVFGPTCMQALPRNSPGSLQGQLRLEVRSQRLCC